MIAFRYVLSVIHLASVACALPKAAQKQPETTPGLRFEVTYSGDLIDVGDLDIGYAVWTSMYQHSDGHGVMSEATYKQFSPVCNDAESKPDLVVGVSLSGRWGSRGGRVPVKGANKTVSWQVNSWQMRDALVQSMTQAIVKTAEPHRRKVYSQCRGTTWFSAVSATAKAPCGPLSKQKSCECPMMRIGAQCMRLRTGHRVPSSFWITVYESQGDRLVPDEYKVVFKSSSQDRQSNRCGRPGAVSEVLASEIPVVGKFIERAIKIFCRQTNPTDGL